jgi:hypothetical protein
MVEPLTKKPFVFGSGPDRLIRVMAASDGFHPLTFLESEIQGVAERGQDRSALVLRSGVEIPVALSYEQLEQKIYQPDFKNDGPVFDLRDVTAEVARPKTPANTNQAPAPGDKMPDGTVFAGISPDTNEPMYATPADASLTMKFNQATDYAAKLNTNKYLGHDDWRVPTKNELNVLFNNRAAIGGFNVSGSLPAGWYWSAKSYTWTAWCQRFSDGRQGYNLFGGKVNHSAVRLVR